MNGLVRRRILPCERIALFPSRADALHNRIDLPVGQRTLRFFGPNARHQRTLLAIGNYVAQRNIVDERLVFGIGKIGCRAVVAVLAMTAGAVLSIQGCRTTSPLPAAALRGRVADARADRTRSGQQRKRDAQHACGDAPRSHGLGSLFSGSPPRVPIGCSGMQARRLPRRAAPRAAPARAVRGVPSFATV